MLNKTNTSSIMVLVLCFLFYSFDYFFRMSQSIVVPQLSHQYGMGVIGIAAFASAFYLGYALFQFPFGFMLDRCAINILMAISVIICSLCYLLFLYATSFWLGYFLRFMIGASSAIAFIGVLYVARLYIKVRYFPFLAGLAIAIGTLSASVVQFIGAFLIERFDWHYALGIFGLLSCGVGLLFLVFSLPQIESTKRPGKLATQKAIWQLIRQKNLVCNAVIGGLFYLPTTILASLWGIPFMIAHYHVDRITATVAIMFLFLGWAIGSPLFGVMAGFYRKTAWLMMVTAFLGGLISLDFIFLKSISDTTLFLIMGCLGLASSGQTLVWKVFDACCPRRLSGLGIALTNTIIMLSSSLFHLIVGFFIDEGSNKVDIHYLSYQKGLWIIPVLFFVVSVWTFWLSRTNNNYII